MNRNEVSAKGRPYTVGEEIARKRAFADGEVLGAAALFAASLMAAHFFKEEGSTVVTRVGSIFLYVDALRRKMKATKLEKSFPED